LHDDRAVEAERLAHHFRIGLRRVRRQQQRQRIGRQRAQHEEHDHRQQQHGRDCADETPCRNVDQ
jgi:hypothetical protein